jgi:hypothetical protein
MSVRQKRPSGGRGKSPSTSREAASGKAASPEVAAQNQNGAALEQLPGPLAANDLAGLSRLLQEERVPIVQRRALALRVGRILGNRYLQGALAGPVRPSPAAPHIQRGEAGVHQDIEMTAWGVKKPTDPSKMTPEQKAAMEAYVGNWMRDFSQFFVPTAFEAVAKAPKRPGDLTSAPIGAKGAEKAMTGLLQALAAMEFGPAITKKFVTGPLLGTYRPEEHMDNPAGMSLGGDVLVRDKGGALNPGDKVPRSEAERQIQGSAGLGPQLENPKLYGVSGEGLAKHIYNTKEWVKKQFMAAHAAGAAGGRLHFASGLHGVEDYYAHSNFIEVALNNLLTGKKVSLPALLKGLPKSGHKKGVPVDTLFDPTVKVGKKERLAITTGTFGPKDTQISIAHALLPRLPALFTGIDQAIDQALGLLEKEKMTWAEIKKKLDETPAGSATNFLLDGLEAAGVELPVLILDKWTIPDLPDFLPDSIEHFLEGRWLVLGYDQKYLPPSKAIPTYQELYRDLKAIWENRDVLSKMLWAVLKIPGLDPQTVEKIRKAKEFLSKSLTELTKEFKKQLKRQIRLYIMKAIEGMTGVNVPEKKRGELEKWMEHIHHGVEGKVAETSLETRLKDKEDLGGLSPEEKKKRIPGEGAYPPSHSEISKDHPAPKKKASHSVHTEEGRSGFYEMHRELAIFADKHLTVLMEDAWKDTHGGGTIVPGKPASMDAKSRKALDKAAEERAAKVKKLAGKEGMTFSQNDPAMSSKMKALLNAVDLYIAHPDDGEWWRPLMTKYINAHPEEVLADIEARNKTRGARK